MKIGILILLIVLGLVAAMKVIRMRRKTGDAAAPPEGPPGEHASVTKARTDIKEHGWHFLMIQGGDDGPSFLYTVGLWETYKHPEILLFAASRDPKGMMSSFTALAERVVAGEKLTKGQVYSKVFKEHGGAVRDVLPRWFPSFLGTAGAVYGNFDFPAVQVYWPDREGHFPWESEFDRKFYPFQPILYQDNAVLANVGAAEVQRLTQEEGPQVLADAFADLFVRLGGVSREDLLADWRWRVGPDAELLHVTVFGDLFLKTPDGHIHWLDTGANFYQDVAADGASWLRLVCDRPAPFFHASTLLHFRSLSYRPGEGEVYSWIQPPMLGGKDSVNNFGTASTIVHVSHLGRTAQSLATDSEDVTSGRPGRT